ncbi:MAG: hypothetical protein R3F28_05075 [Candidatus Kapaibacterium sp.]
MIASTGWPSILTSVASIETSNGDKLSFDRDSIIADFSIIFQLTFIFLCRKIKVNWKISNNFLHHFFSPPLSVFLCHNFGEAPSPNMTPDFLN